MESTKLVQWIDEDLVELFDLESDLGEQKNLTVQMPDRTEKMLESLLSIEESIGNLREKGRKALQQRLRKKTRSKNN